MLVQMRVLSGVLAVITALGITAACAMQAIDNEKAGSRMVEKTIEAVLKEHNDRLMSLPGVVGTAIGECQGKPCIKVMVVKRSPELVKKVPPRLEGFPVAIEETGEIRRLDTR